MYFTQQSRSMTTRTHRKIWLLHALRVLNAPLSLSVLSFRGGFASVILSWLMFGSRPQLKTQQNPEQTWHAPNRTTPTTHSLTLVSECSKRYTSNMVPPFVLGEAPSPQPNLPIIKCQIHNPPKTGPKTVVFNEMYLFLNIPKKKLSIHCKRFAAHEALALRHLKLREEHSPWSLMLAASGFSSGRDPKLGDSYKPHGTLKHPFLVVYFFFLYSIQSKF